MLFLYLISAGVFAYLFWRGKKRMQKDKVVAKYYVKLIVYGDYQKAMLGAVNELRLQNDSRTLRAGARANSVAKNRLEEIIEEYRRTGKISHMGFADDSKRLVDAGAKKVGENLNKGFWKEEASFKAWVNSTSHFKAMTNPVYDVFGYARGIYKGKLFRVMILIDTDGNA